MTVDAAQKRADHVRISQRESGRGSQPGQSRAANFRRRGVASLAADLLEVFQLAIGLDHTPAIFEPLFFLGRQRLAQAKMRQNLRDLVGGGAEQANLTLIEFAALQGLRDQHTERLLVAVENRDAKKSVVALLASLGKILVARMTDRVGHVNRFVLLQNQPHQPFADTHRDLADRFAIEADGGAQDYALALRIEKVERAYLGLHSSGDRGDHLIESFAQVFRMLPANSGKMFNEGKAIFIRRHL